MKKETTNSFDEGLEMAKITITWCVVFIILIVLGTAIISFQINEYIKNEDKLSETQLKSWIELTGKEYSDDYNCLNFSQDLVRKLNKESYFESEVVYGKYKGSDHAFVKVCFFVEATTGEVITERIYSKDYQKYEDYYKKLWEQCVQSNKECCYTG